MTEEERLSELQESITSLLEDLFCLDCLLDRLDGKGVPFTLLQRMVDYATHDAQEIHFLSR